MAEVRDDVLSPERASVDRVEGLLALGAAATRLAVLAASCFSVSVGWAVTTNRVVYAALVVVTFGVTLALTVRLLVLRLMPARPCWITDALVVALAVLGLGLVTPPADPRDPGVGLLWAAGLCGNACTTVGLWARRRLDLLGAVVMIGTYLLVAFGLNKAPAPLVLSNAAMWAGFTCATWVVASNWRALAREADTLRAVAVREAARAGELAALDRARLVVHDPAAILRMIADPDTPPESFSALRQQAATEAVRLRSFMSDTRTVPAPATVDPAYDGCPGPGDPTLAGAVRAGVEGFADLPIELAVDLAEGVVLAPPVAEALTQAVATCLHNVREHAGAALVVVHADACRGGWEVTVRDDGRGFDVDRVVPGHGLRALVRDNLAAQGVRAHVASAPGEGCTVTMTGAC
ncbi:sensor histidine kinase [Arsenicicoccus dermatophilus]|uniref:sensor histidine kinase n=1 Tax=Arsenicicoccus dermatophilus TaxID=1076331 RepID=UPI003917159B